MSDVDLKGLFLKHAAALRGYLARRVRDPQLAADLVQESFLRLAEHTRGAPIDNSQGYLYRTANNLLIDHVRQEARRKTEAVPHEVLAEIEDDGAGLEAQAMALQQRMALKQAVAELPERTREIFRLNRIEGMTHAEVARHLDISDSSVQKHLSKALAYVMQRLQSTDGRPVDP
ncbi:RNA polymerase sigma factor [Pseudomonas piscis]|uniref:RNA polymerase sigma factor n=1 Tax=Pseudomonas piscis TaxID=2614538 RepID=UPI0021D5C219|nr:RNA polymerase sigma factor [Pseudomonas piscis]MCU7651109.1 RNA polymerase sigma factor [Pseudomonas piscis]